MSRSIPVEVDETGGWSPFPEDSLEEALEPSNGNVERLVPVASCPSQMHSPSSTGQSYFYRQLYNFTGDYIVQEAHGYRSQDSRKEMPSGHSDGSTSPLAVHLRSKDKRNQILRSQLSADSPDTGRNSSALHRNVSDISQSSLGEHQGNASQFQNNRMPLDLRAEDAGYDSQPMDVMGIRQLEPPLPLTSSFNLLDLPRSLKSREFPEMEPQLCPELPQMAHPNHSPQAQWHPGYYIPAEIWEQNPYGQPLQRHFAHPCQAQHRVPEPCIRVMQPARQIIANCSSPYSPRDNEERLPPRDVSAAELQAFQVQFQNQLLEGRALSMAYGDHEEISRQPLDPMAQAYGSPWSAAVPRPLVNSAVRGTLKTSNLPKELRTYLPILDNCE